MEYLAVSVICCLPIVRAIAVNKFVIELTFVNVTVSLVNLKHNIHTFSLLKLACIVRYVKLCINMLTN